MRKPGREEGRRISEVGMFPPPEAVSDRDKGDKPIESRVSCVASVSASVNISVHGAK